MSIRVTKTKSGKKRYAARVHLGGGNYKVLGTRSTRKEARKLELKWELAREAPERVLGRDFAKRWLAAYEERSKASSYVTARAALRCWHKTFGNRSLHSLAREEAQKWGAKHRWACGPVITMLNEAMADGLIERNPFRGMARKGKGRADKTPLTVAEVTRLAEIAGGEWGERMRAFVLFAAYTGMRVGELFALRWEDIDFQRNRIMVRQRFYENDLDVPKGGSAKEISLLPEARAALATLDRSAEWVFLNKEGGRLRKSSLSYYWSPIRAAFGRYVTPHELRHFCAHHLYVTLNYPARVVAAQLRHTSERLIQELYGHGDVGALEEIERSYVERSNVVPLRRASNA